MEREEPALQHDRRGSEHGLPVRRGRLAGVEVEHEGRDVYFNRDVHEAVSRGVPQRGLYYYGARYLDPKYSTQKAIR